MRADSLPLVTTLMRCGAIAGPLFLCIVLIQDYSRPGYDPRLVPLSLLSLGEFGWIQIANFLICGALNLCYAAGLRKSLRYYPGGMWAPILIGGYGVGLVVVGVFTTDPSLGFPPGTAAPNGPTWHGAIHALGGLFTFVCLTAALGVLARVFIARRERAWACFCGLAALALPALFFSSFINLALTARFLRLATLIGWIASSMAAIKLSRRSTASRQLAL